MVGLANLAENLQDPQGPLQRLLGDLTAVTGKLERGKGAVGRLLNEDTLALDFDRTILVPLQTP